MVKKLPTLKSAKTFSEKSYAFLRQVPRGKVTTYAALAHAMDSKAYRAVGTAMNKNPYAPIVPCHRVISSDLSIGGFATGTKKKLKMLADEGVFFKGGKLVDKKCLFVEFK